MRTALITGANGQDGVFLSRFLLDLGYTVHGTVRGGDRKVEAGVVKHVLRDTGQRLPESLFEGSGPDEIYLLGGESFAGVPRHGIVNLLESNVMGIAHILEFLDRTGCSSRVFLAGSAAVFGDAGGSPQNEDTPRAANSLYGASKAILHSIADLCRKSGRFVAIGILYNHESPLRPDHFVTRKITSTAARIAAGSGERLKLGNLDVVRDWGHASDYVRAMWQMLQADQAEDWVVATGKGHTVREFCRHAFGLLGLDYLNHVDSVPEFWRPAEKVPLVGDPCKIERNLQWKREIGFEELIEEMVRHDVALVADTAGG